MAKIGKFEDIEAWQKAREVTRAIYRVTNQGAFAKDLGLCDQIHCAAVPIILSLERIGNAEFIQLLYIAKGSSAEVEAQLYVALDAGSIQPCRRCKPSHRQIHPIPQNPKLTRYKHRWL